jgi:Cd(II)/Pb(II)-responsive transcriptional regulator
MKIGALAEATGTQVETIRYYEREELLPETARSEGNFRIYGPAHVERLQFIRHCRGLDMSLDEVRMLLKFKDDPSSDCGDVNALLDEHIGHVSQRIKELRSLEKQLKDLRSQCKASQDAGHCGILSGIAEASKRPSKPRAKAQHHLQGIHSKGQG